jgi:hypothetical protein
MGPLLQSCPDDCANFSAIALFDNCVEHCSPQAAATYGPPLAQAVVDGIQDGNEDIQKVSLYSVAEVARYTPGTILEPYAQTLVSKLVPLASSRKSDDSACVVDYAVSVLASLSILEPAPLVSASFSILTPF